MTNQPVNRSDTVDLQEVSRLVEALERDLDKIRAGSTDLESLRKEVEQLRSALDAPHSAHNEIDDGLRAIRALLHRAGEELQRDAIKVTEYVAHVGRMLGM
ncbi:MAG: hypothetical protein ACKVQT_02825 [Burkholderiales bacterium]